MSRAIVTGATGFIGRRLVARLVADGHDVVCLTRGGGAGGAVGGGVREVAVDLLDPDTYAPLLPGADVVVHLAGVINSRRVAEYRRINELATRLLVEACLRAGAGRGRFLLMSSVAAMGPARGGALLREADPCRPGSAYGRSKRAAEVAALARADGMPLVVLRPSFVYGPGDERALPVLPALLGGVVTPAARQIGTFSVCHVADVVEACRLALVRELPSGGIFLVSGPEVLTWDGLRDLVSAALGELAPELAARLRARCERERPGRGAAPAPGSVHSWACDTAEARRALGFAARVPLADGVRETVRWYLARGWTPRAVTGRTGLPEVEAS